MPVLRVQTLGEVRLTRETGEPIALRRKPLALLAYIARRSPRPVSRAELATLIWGDRAEDRARQSLRQALLELKQAVGEVLEVNPETVRLGEGTVALDLADFERDVREQRFEVAAERWRGDFFPDVEEIGGDGFERWVESERVASLGRLGKAMEHLIGGAELRADWDGAHQLAARWAAAAPFDERAHSRLVETLRMRGRASEAVSHHAEFVARLRASLDVEPSPEFRRLAGGLAEQARTEAARRARPSTAVRAPAFIGRGHELAEVVAAWRAAGEGRLELVLVDSDAGGGKTRLCDEAERAVRESTRRLVVLRAAGSASHASLDTARLLFAGLAEAPGSAGASAESLAEVAALVPAIADSFPHLPAPTGGGEALRDALRQLLEAVSEEVPILVLVDDAHLADPDSRQLITGLAARVKGRVAIILVGAMSGRETGGVLDTLFAIPGVLRVSLRPLDVAEVGAMIGSMVSVAESDQERLAERVHDDSRGVPLLVYEFVAEMVDQRLLALDRAGEWRLSPSVDGRPLPLSAAISARVGAELSRLSSPARTLLDAAAVLGPPVDNVLLESVAGLEAGEASVALRELVTRRYVREEIGSRQVVFAHPIIGRVAYSLLSPSERESRHARAAEEMSARDMTRTAERSILPYHLARAGSTRTPTAPMAVPRAPSRKWPAIAAAAVLVTAVLAGASWYVRREPAAATAAADEAGRRRVVVGAFQNRTGRADLDRVRDIAVDWIVRGLDETGMVEIAGARHGSAEARGAVTAQASDAELRTFARDAHAATIVTGSLHLLGDSLELQAIVLDARNGSLLRALLPVRASLADPLDGVNRMQRQVVGALAALLDPQFDGGGNARPPPDYAAYLAFMRGEDAYVRNQVERAEASYREAASVDSTFPLALLRLAYAAFGGGHCERVDSIGRVLDGRQGLMSGFEVHYLERVRSWCRGDWHAANEAARRMADLSPRSYFAQFAAVNSGLSVNRPVEALARLRKIDPSRSFILADGLYWLTLVGALHMASDDDELRVVAAGLDTLPRDVFVLAASAFAAGVAGSEEEVVRIAPTIAGSGGGADGVRRLQLLLALDELRVHGTRGAASAASARVAAQIAPSAAEGAGGDTTRFLLAELLYRAERWREAHELAVPLGARHASNPFVVALLGRAAARVGDREGAMRAAELLSRMSGTALKGAHTYGRARIAAVLGDREEALRLLHAAVADGLPYSPDGGSAYFGHSDMDLESIIGEPGVQALLKPRG